MESFQPLEPRQLLCSFGFHADSQAAPAAQLAALAHRPEHRAPAHLKAVVRAEDHIRLTWDDRSRNERGFVVQRSTDGKKFRTIAAVGRNAERFHDKNVPEEAPLFYRVRAFTKHRASRPTNVVQVAAHALESPTGGRLSDAVTSIKWAGAAPNPITRFEANSAAVNGKLYVFGGYYNSSIDVTDKSHVYDPSANKWSGLPDMPQGITHAGVAVDGETVYLAGGYVGDWKGSITDRVLTFDTSIKTWSDGPALPGKRGAGALVRVGRNLHFFGGVDSSFEKDRAEHWVLDLDNPGAGWTAAAPMPNARNHFGYAALDGKIYAIGGQHGLNETAGNLRDVHRYDPATDKWSTLAPLPKVRSHTHTSTVVLDGKIIVLGGATNGSPEPRHLADVTQYDPAKNAWSSLTALPKTLEATSAQAIGGKVYVTGGAVVNVNLTTSTYVGTPQYSSTPAPAPSAAFEAENAFLKGVRIARDHSGYSGSGFGDYILASDEYVEWTVDSPARTATLEFRYAAGAGDRPLKLIVNGATVRSSLNFPSTGSWTTWKTVTVTTPLKDGPNKVRLISIGKSGPNLDRLAVR